jgi:hypothetical protein
MPSWIGPWEILILLFLAAVVVTVILLVRSQNSRNARNWNQRQYPPQTFARQVFCPSCGARVTPPDRYCSVCGMRVG